MSAIVKCENVSIRYITGDFKDIGLKEYLIRRLTKQYHVTEFWADRHVTFELQPGDMLGIIGSNGAGKSTLLKAISGIMVPTEGKVTCSAKISALLELGSGFDGDLTVRENTYLRAAMLGYSREFVDGMYDSIIDFAELRDFQDRPFKQLSSGMKSRLAFSIASLVEPEILILDEVLSVGDGAFRKKSEAKMRQIISGGATTILVSHSVGQVRSLCNKILWLNRGEQVAFGTNVRGLCDAYQKFLDTKVLPKPEELPPMDIPGEVHVAASNPAPALNKAVSSADAPAISASADSGDACETAGVGVDPFVRPRVSQFLKKIPRAVSATVVALVVLTMLIAISEATLPSRVRALVENPARVIYTATDDSVRVCAWDGRLYLFLDREIAQGAMLGVQATDNHGNTMSDVVDVAAVQTKRYGTPDELVLEINLAKYPGAVEIRYGMVDPASASAKATSTDGFSWLWQETYRP